MDEQAEKLLALGKLAANLSHELNNPASAAQRSAVSLSAELRDADEAKYRLVRLFRSEEELEQYNSWVKTARDYLHASSGFSPIPQSPLEASDYEEKILRWLEERKMAWVVVDAPKVDAVNVPGTLVAVTSPVAYVRFHGRNTATWEDPEIQTAAERFRYRYREDELREWVPRIREMAASARVVHVLMNNCYRDDAAVNAAELAELLTGD